MDLFYERLLSDEKTWQDFPDQDEQEEMPLDGWPTPVVPMICRRLNVRPTQGRACHICGKVIDEQQGWGKTCLKCLDRLSVEILPIDRAEAVKEETERKQLKTERKQLKTERKQLKTERLKQENDYWDREKQKEKRQKSKRRPRLDADTIEKWVVDLKKQDKSIPEIMETVGVGRRTVVRILTKSWWK